jgi:hypothetical protein
MYHHFLGPAVMRFKNPLSRKSEKKKILSRFFFFLWIFIEKKKKKKKNLEPNALEKL